MTYEVGDYRTVDSFGEEYTLVQQDSEAASILDYIGFDGHENEYHYLFVKFDDSGADYAEVWGVAGVPYVWRETELLFKGE